MSYSVLLQLARDSIEEVLQADNKIDKISLLKQYPLLNEKISITLILYVNQEFRASYNIDANESSLFDNIVLSAKKVAFEDKNRDPISILEYLHCELELLLETPDGELIQKDQAILQTEL